MSRRPGLGTEWFNKYHDDVYPDDFVIIQGKKFRPPKHYDKLLEQKNPELMEQLKVKRQNVTKQKSVDETYERRNVRDTVIKAKLLQKQRQL